MIRKIAKQITDLKNPETVSAHCDGPCGIYDPASARVAAEAGLSMTKKLAALTVPSTDDAAA